MDKDMTGKVIITAECFAGFVERAAQAEAQVAYMRIKCQRAEEQLEQLKREYEAVLKALHTAEAKLALYEGAAHDAV